MNRPEIDKYHCLRCGQCVSACPSRLLYRSDANEYPSVVENAEQRCISCHHCIAVCPVGAVSVGEVNESLCQPFAKESIPRFEHIATLARMRRSIRRYAETPVNEQALETLMDVVRWSPSAKNGLPVKWLIVNNRAKVGELAGLVVDWMGTQAGTEEIVETWKQGGDPIFRGAPCLIVAYTDETALWPVVDATIAVETLDLCATAMRLGTCWAGFFIRAAQNDPAIGRWLGLSKTETVQGGLMIGTIGDEVYQKIPYRPELQLRWIR